MKIPQETINTIRENTDIVELISQYLPLKRSGKNFVALCPFHKEKTPSFTISPDKQIFYCFGCGKGGNVYSFLMEYEKISFLEAVKILANKAGISLTITSKEESRAYSQIDALYSANKFAASFYHRV